MGTLFARLMPFVLLGVAIVAFFFGLILLTYLLILGSLVGLILFAANWIKEKFFSRNQLVKRKSEKPGRIIEHDHKDK